MTIKQQGGVFGRNPSFNDTETNDLIVNDKLGVGAGTPAANAKAHISRASSGASVLSNTTLALESTGDVILDMLSPATGRALIVFGNSTSIQRGDLLYDHNADTLRVRVANATQATFNTSGLAFPNGKGIDFSATSGTGTSELFDDYEEGTYTVSLHDGSSGGNASPTTTTGYYTKVGRVVTCSFASLSNISTAGMTSTNVLYMSLPFSAAQSASGSMAISDVDARQALLAGYIVPIVLSGNSRARFYGCQSGNAEASIRPAELTSGTSDFINFTMTYIAS